MKTRKAVWLTILCLLICGCALSEEDPFVTYISQGLQLEKEFPDYIKESVGLYQSLYTLSAIVPGEDVQTLLNRIEACRLQPFSVETSGEDAASPVTKIWFSSFYGVELQGDPAETADLYLEFKLTKHRLSIPINTQDTEAADVLGKSYTRSAYAKVPDMIRSKEAYEALERIYEDEQGMPSYASFIMKFYESATKEFQEMADLVNFLYPGMEWKDFLRLLEYKGIDSQWTKNEEDDGRYYWEKNAVRVGYVRLTTEWENEILQEARIWIDPWTAGMFELATEMPQMVYCPHAVIDLNRTWISQQMLK